MSRKRTRIEIIRDILDVIKQRNGKIKPTHILYKSNLSHQMMDEYLKELITKDFILEHKDEKSRTYSISDKGQKFLERYRMISEFAESFGLG